MGWVRVAGVLLATVMAWAGVARGAGTGEAAPELTPAIGWLNTDRPLRFSDELRGRVVLLDFWTQGCINCMQVLPDLEYLEQKYKDDPFIVVGVHSAKFTESGTRQSVRNAVERYGMHHPVVIDRNMAIWNKYDVHTWPTFVLVGADGKIIGSLMGEGQLPRLDTAVQKALDDGRRDGTLATTPLVIHAGETVEPVGGLRYPGKVEAVGAHGKFDAALFIADTGNNRVVETTWPDAEGACRVVRVYGTGEAGFESGSAGASSFNGPQGMCADAARRTVYVADRANHAIRAIDRVSGWVSTVSGTGQRGFDQSGGGNGTSQPLASPWDVAMGADNRRVYIAMAGLHQLWELELNDMVARAIAGSGVENSVDGWAPDAALAQPSGIALSGDGTRLYFADSESSSVKVLDLGTNTVSTIIGHVVEGIEQDGLFTFGDVDGTFPDARLQHPLGVAVMPTAQGERVLVADTYNDKIKLVDPAKRSVATWIGGPAGDASAGSLHLDEPGGVDFAKDASGRGWVFVADTNDHRIVMIDAATKEWHEVMISGLEAPRVAGSGPAPKMAVLEVTPGQNFKLTVAFDLGPGKRVNRELPASIRVTAMRAAGTDVLAQKTVRTETPLLSVTIPGAQVRDGERWLVESSLAWCDEDRGVCVPVEGKWVVMVEGGEGAQAGTLKAKPVANAEEEDSPQSTQRPQRPQR